MDPIFEPIGGFSSIKEDTDNIETIFMSAKERKEKYLSARKTSDQETLLKINKCLNDSDDSYIIWQDSVLSDYCINFLKEKGYIVSEEFDSDCFYYIISFNV